MNITRTVKYVGVNDRKVDLFEGQYNVPNGMAYNSYIIFDEQIAVMDTVEKSFTDEWLGNIASELGERKPDYLIVQHMEPDHSANIVAFMRAYPEAKVVASQKALDMMLNFYGDNFPDRCIVAEDGSTLSLGNQNLTFFTAPMVHWPEVLMTYDVEEKILFSADAFGKFGALDAREDWKDEARRYYFGIVGKYGVQVQAVLQKLAGIELKCICPLHGPVLRENLKDYVNLYSVWSDYSPESDGVVIAYTSVYGNTLKAVELLAGKLREKGCKNVIVNDLARKDMSQCIADSFRYGKTVFATTTYNGDIFPFMRTFISGLTERGFRNRTVAFIENGSWAPQAAKIMKKLLENSKNLTYANNDVSILSSVNDNNRQQIEQLAAELTEEYGVRNGITAKKSDMKALFNIGYGLYVVTCNDGRKDNGLIVNTVTQVTSTPYRVAVCISKQNYSHDIIKKTGVMNVNCLSVDAPFSIFQRFGFHSGRDVNKFEGEEVLRSDNNLVFLSEYINSFMSLSVEQYLDLDTHGMFICSVTEAKILSDRETMTYNYYQSNVKPKPKTEGKRGWVCKICGYIYEGDVLPEDFVCPVCKHGAADFERITL